jgi:hypothetical protein
MLIKIKDRHRISYNFTEEKWAAQAAAIMVAGRKMTRAG